MKSLAHITDSLRQESRVGVFIINALLATSVYISITGFISPFSGKGIWLLGIIAYWLFVLVTAPFFTPPKDALANAISAILLLAPAVFSASDSALANTLQLLHITTLVLAVAVIVLTLVAIFKRSEGKQSVWSNASYYLSTKLGRGDTLFTLVVAFGALAYYQRPAWHALLIMGFWVLMVTIKPVELAIKTHSVLTADKDAVGELEKVGSILRVDDPNIIRVILRDGKTAWQHGEVYLAHTSDGRQTYVLPLFVQLQGEGVVGTGLITEEVSKKTDYTLAGGVYRQGKKALSGKLVAGLSDEDTTKEVAGLVVEGSTIRTIRFQAVRGIDFEEGRVVFCNINDKRVYYQILDARTSEESFDSNPYGMHIISASQLGSFESDKGFRKFPWLPGMNQPVFLASEEDSVEQKLEDDEFVVGKVPSTGFGVTVSLNDLVEYHGAILGITGTGKTELAFDIVKNAVKRDAKVFCVDFTGEYVPRLKEQKPTTIGLSPDNVKRLEGALFAVETGEFGAKEEKAALQKFLDDIRPEIEKQIDEFLMSDNKHLGIFELSEITNTKATLRTTELYLSSIMKWARTNRKARKIMIVLEEAHTIIPETYGSGFDKNTQWVVSRIGQIALQGRKYGVGLLLLSQRTALVSKTVLSQCNTYFTHSLVDKTSLEYLEGVYSSEHVQAIPNLRAREFLASGKAIKSEQPILVKVDFDPNKLKASKELDIDFEDVKKRKKELRVNENIEEGIDTSDGESATGDEVDKASNPDDLPF